MINNLLFMHLSHAQQRRPRSLKTSSLSESFTMTASACVWRDQQLIDIQLSSVSLPGCAEAEAGAPAGVLAQGLVSRAGRAGARAGGLAAAATTAAAAATEKAGAVPFTTADKRQMLVHSKLVCEVSEPSFVRHAQRYHAVNQQVLITHIK